MLKSRVLYCFISPILVLIEEVFLANNKFKTTQSVRDEIAKKAWSDMTEKEKQTMVEYYRFLEYQNERRLQVMAREASIQLIIQHALVLYQFVYPPTRELDYSTDLEIGNLTTINSTFGNFTSAYTIWIFRLSVQFISILLSAYSTFSPILDDMQLQTFKKEQKYVSVLSYVLKIAQILIHIIYATGVVYLLQVTNINSLDFL